MATYEWETGPDDAPPASNRLWESLRRLLIWPACGAGLLFLIALWVGPDRVRALDQTLLELERLAQIPAAIKEGTPEFRHFREVTARVEAMRREMGRERRAMLDVRNDPVYAGGFGACVCCAFATGYAIVWVKVAREHYFLHVRGFCLTSFFLGFLVGAVGWVLTHWAEFLVAMPLYGAVLGLGCRATIPILPDNLGGDPAWMD